METLSETFKDSKSNYVLLAAAALDAENKLRVLQGVSERCKYLERFIKSKLTEQEWGRFCDPTDEFGAISDEESTSIKSKKRQ